MDPSKPKGLAGWLIKGGSAELNAAVAAANQQHVQKEHARMLVGREQRAAAAAAAAAKRKPGRPRKQPAVAHGVQHGASLPTAPNRRRDREAKLQQRTSHRSSKRRQEKHNWWHPAIIMPILDAVASQRGYQ